ncbi:cytoplasmic tRNA 2-thiolation protein 2 [Melanomma pulvis-pyrius CBS 109.77]|uniref:Cytoplasmic tRNA 2-thiolation protein 2 n=1 Tax=Melanomma pulvis-pyrius CBS 109.77 TaxID=1314802 RepID=A0A6A6XVX9_9PLEO|nr:cytoplasmic tRNA 2-thiolation protein 2 [Melanomma pulvis-pyrius CBS 109.77]
MPGKHVGAVAEQPCRRCRDNPSVLVVRTEPLCRDCFLKYVHTKVIKRMESFRVRFSDTDQQRRILLPISFGVSSVTLLSILDQHLRTQAAKTRRTGFSLQVLFVDSSSVEDPPLDDHLLAKVQEQYPDHQYASLPLHDVFRLVDKDTALLTLVPDFRTKKDISAPEQLSSLINSLTSATARADVISSLKTRLVVEHAKSSGCEGVLWGDSTTNLAQKTLSETAKGRGFSLPWQVAEGESPYGITFNYPLRDVLKKELVSFVELSEPSLSPLVHEPSLGATQASMSSKNTTIDDLMKQYFESVEENFPSIVSNVVRTSSKLAPAPGSRSDPHCSLCHMPVVGGRFGIHGWGGDQEDGLETPIIEGAEGLCYGCTRSIPRTATTSNETS